jgi:hypothetical protein
MTDSLATFTHTFRYNAVDTSTGGIDVAHSEQSFVGVLQIDATIAGKVVAEEAFISALVVWLLRYPDGQRLHAIGQEYGMLDFRDLKTAGVFEHPEFLEELRGVGIRINMAQVFEVKNAPAVNDDMPLFPIDGNLDHKGLMVSSLHDF